MRLSNTPHYWEACCFLFVRKLRGSQDVRPRRFDKKMSFQPHLGLLHPRNVPWIPRMMVLKGVFSLNKSSVMLGNHSIHHISASFHNREKANSVKIGTLKQVATDGNDPRVYIWFDVIWPLHCEWLVSYSSVTPPDTWIRKKAMFFQ